MKRIQHLNCLIIIALFMTSVCFAQNPYVKENTTKPLKFEKSLKSKDLKTKAYCFVTGSTFTLPAGPAFFYLDKPDSIVSIADQSASNYIVGGTWSNQDKWYGTVYSENKLITIDIATGARKVIGTMSTGMYDIAYDHTTNTLYGLSYNIINKDTGSFLYRINQTTGATTVIGKSTKALLFTLACDTLGNLYALSQKKIDPYVIYNSNIYTIDKNTGAGTILGNASFKANYFQGMEFDRKTNICYLSAYNDDARRGELRTCNLTTGATSLIGVFKDNAEITGFAIPYLTSKINDVAAVSIDEDLVVQKQIINPIAKVMNKGLPATFEVTMKISNGYTSTKTVSNLDTYKNISIIFDPWDPALGEYTISVYTKLAGDVDALNDTIKQHISVLNLTKVYCYVASGSQALNIPVGPAYTYLQKPGKIISLARQGGMYSVFGGTWGGNNKWLGSVSVYQDNAHVADSLITFDTLTGGRKTIGKMGAQIFGLAYDFTTSTLYGTSYDGSTNSSLYKINTTTGATTLIGNSVAGFLVNLACDTLGRLFSVNVNDSKLYSLNKKTGLATAIGHIGFTADKYLQGMSFDNNTNTCYMAALNKITGGELRTVNVSTGATTLIGPFAGGVEITALAIPFLFEPKTIDVLAASIDEPTLRHLETISPKGTVSNRGKTATFDVTMDISDGYTSTIAVTDLAPFNSQQITFKPWNPEAGDYTITLTTKLTGDINASNNVLTQAISIKKMKKVYCYIWDDLAGNYPKGPAYSYLEAPQLVVSMANQSSEQIVRGATWGGLNKWYGAVGTDNKLITIDTITGARTIIGNLGVGILGLAYDYKTFTLYGISYNSSTSNSSLYKINENTGAATLIGKSITGTLVNLACDTMGNLYSININNDYLYSIDKNTGLGTGIGPIGFDTDYYQGMKFDNYTNICYMSTYNKTSAQAELRTINVSTGSTTLIGQIVKSVQLTGLAIPFNGKGVGVNELSKNVSFSIYPNPAKNIVNISSTENIKNIRICNLLGQVVLRKDLNSTNASINTSGIVEGVYFLQIETGKGTATRKLIISK